MTARGGKVQVGNVYVVMWPVLLACFSVVIVSYAKRYDKRIAAIYVAVMLVVITFSAIQSNGLKQEAWVDDPCTIIRAILLYMGFTGCAILLSLCVVAEKRPIKIRRWLRFSYLCLGAFLLSQSIVVYTSNPGVSIWRWDVQANVLLVLWLLEAMLLHGRQSYSKAACILPFLFIIIAKNMSARISILAITVMGVVTLGLAVKDKAMAVPTIPHKDMVQLFRLATMGYGILLLAASICSRILEYRLPDVIYNTMTIAYVLSIVVFMLVRQERLSYLGYVMAIVWDVAFVLLVKVVYPEISIAALAFLCICILPAIFFVIQIKKTWNSGVEVSHMALLLMILAGILCCALRNVYMGSARVCLYLFWIGAGGMLLYTLYCMIRRRV
ncbi:MAG: hypothetical protein Q4G58_13180 [bacterium]|nr:hypothetical protein [bacterium]